MKRIRKVSLIGLGALGVMYSHHMTNHLATEELRIIVDEDRKVRYMNQGIYCNEELCKFNYVTPEEEVEPADLLVFAVKYMNLGEAIIAAKNHVGEDTIILSVLNGVVSESDIAKVYGSEHNLYCVAQGMTAKKELNRVTYGKKGVICFGELNEELNTPKVERVKSFFDSIQMPYEINNQMETKLWSKLMANVGINQTVAYKQCTNDMIQVEGEARDLMIKAMEEVLLIAEALHVGLKYSDIEYWLQIIDTLDPKGMPSMAQDVKANRGTEIELFGGTIVKLGREHCIDVPVNEMFYNHFSKSKYV